MNYRWCGVCCPILTLAFLVACGGRGGTGSGSGGGPNGGGPTVETSAHPPIRTQYRRTDLQYNPNALQFFPPHITAYDSIHNRFFISNTTQNRIDVFDATQESQIGSIVVPEPWGMDVAPDDTKLYVATTFGDVYLIDPGTLQVVERFPSSTIGPAGYIATQAFILADGRLALLGSIGGFYFDGSPNFAIWDPASNAITALDAQLPNFGSNIGQMAVTADRTKVLIGGAKAQYVELYDPSTNTTISVNVTCGGPEEILPTPDGNRIILIGLSGNVEVLDAATLADLGQFPNVPGYSGVLSQDGSTLYTVDFEANVLAWDSTTFVQKGWVPSFDVVDLQQGIIASSIDETGLIFGPIGHGVAFLDSTTMQQGKEGTQFNIGFLSPGTGPMSGTGVQAEVLTPQPAPSITTGTVYVGNGQATNVSLSATSFSGAAPPSSIGGSADFTVMLPDNSLRIMPENFSYGPTIVEVSTNATPADGGAQGTIFGYGLDGAQITVGGQVASVKQSLTTASPNFPYPFPMEAVLFTIPPGTAGTVADIAITTEDGSATASKALEYVPAAQSFPLAGASLMQGVYDAQQSAIYFTDRVQIDVFSQASQQWSTPIAIPYANISSRLYGISLSPDGNTLAVSDAGNAKIYVLHPSSPQIVNSFDVSQQLSGYEPCGLAVTNSAVVYYATFDLPSSQSGITAFHKLNTTNGSITDFNLVEDVGQNEDDSYIRVLLSPDGSRVYVNENGHAWILDTSDDSLSAALQVTVDEGSVEMAISADGNELVTAGFLTDDYFNAISQVAYVDRDVWLPVAVYGQKLNSDGSLLFQPLTNGIDVIGGTTGLLQERIALPIQIADVYDALVLDNADQLVFAITPGGIAKVDLDSLSSTQSASRKALAVKQRYSKQPPGLRHRVIASHDWLHRPHLRYNFSATRAQRSDDAPLNK